MKWIAALLVITSAQFAQAFSVYTCVAQDHQYSYQGKFSDKAIAQDMALKECQAQSSSPRACYRHRCDITSDQSSSPSRVIPVPSGSASSGSVSPCAIFPSSPSCPGYGQNHNGPTAVCRGGKAFGRCSSDNSLCCDYCNDGATCIQ